LQEELEKMKEATSGGTGRNYVVVEAHRCAKGTQPPGTVGYLAMVFKGWANRIEKAESFSYQRTLLRQRSLKELSIAATKQDANTFKEEKSSF
jgi:hypothetical protein